ncbi:Dynein light chain Tctex-type 3, partial [Perkinsus olseni]
VSQILQATIKTDDEYEAKKAQEWADQIGLKVVAKLKEASGNFKYIVSVTIQEKGAGLHHSATCHWDPTADGSVTVRWDQALNMDVVITVFALAL